MGVQPVIVENKTKNSEIKIAAYIACHSSVNSVEHLGEIVQDSFHGDFRLHRTKCAALIRNVISPECKKELLTDLKGMPFSLIIDESTDVGTKKQLCAMVRYFSLTQ